MIFHPSVASEFQKRIRASISLLVPPLALVLTLVLSIFVKNYFFESSPTILIGGTYQFSARKDSEMQVFRTHRYTLITEGDDRILIQDPGPYYYQHDANEAAEILSGARGRLDATYAFDDGILWPLGGSAQGKFGGQLRFFEVNPNGVISMGKSKSEALELNRRVKNRSVWEVWLADFGVVIMAFIAGYGTRWVVRRARLAFSRPHEQGQSSSV